MQSSRRSLLAVYLNDHLAGATAGTQLLRRAARRHRDDAIGRELGELAREVAEDRRSLQRIMSDLGLPRQRLRIVAGWAGERAVRFKPNGRLLRRSPLSDLIDVEAMRLGVEGKAAAWRTLADLVADEHRLKSDDLHRLLHRAERQAEVLERLRRQSAAQAWGAGETSG
ncbi:hypothetical protein RM572_05615 [Streptomyces sp. DSM 42041]|uniref:Uncharacterized protein n=1 Tax=Streptomyces hazeniae TaxID=3075538 RepID=A0ABU2NMR8_9ACTN|nr:hypothetical protein [Streptomyces sp. DSM 42041]MDT0378256.1 hypothetical protein [Streptomyces sp. DSM 42041]